MGDQWAKTRYLDASALVKLVADEGDSLAVQQFFRVNVNFCATSLCLAEALGVLKGKWQHGHLTDAQYFECTHRLIIDASCKRIEVDDIGLFTPNGRKWRTLMRFGNAPRRSGRYTRPKPSCWRRSTLWSSA